MTKTTTVTVIRVSGEEETHKVSQATMFKEIEHLIGAATLDHFTLRRPTRIVWVDDIGLQRKLPINPKATALYRSICRPGTQGVIVGDVAITEGG